jgi:two-component system sensor histidine kinase EvgS
LQFSAEHAQAGAVPAVIHATVETSQRLNILVAEDHAPNRLLLCQQLEYLGHRVVACDDGAAAMAEWLQADPPFDLTITDCNMPNMDGYELAREMRSIELKRAWPSHPIFGLTANARSEIVEECLKAGMTQCLFKPITIEALTQQVGEVAVRIERRVRAARTTGGELQKLRVLSPDSYLPLVDELVRTNREDGARLEQLVLNNDLQKMIGVAHKIKGGAQLADAQTLIEACVQLESAAHQGDGPGCRNQVDRLLTAIQELEDQLLQDR